MVLFCNTFIVIDLILRVLLIQTAVQSLNQFFVKLTTEDFQKFRIEAKNKTTLCTNNAEDLSICPDSMVIIGFNN